ncbi:ABC transporter permease [Chitinophaga solisilvae]|uniref:ABC transporter permease n=1 Tax=Chitinophaga solisilvae TaxID=1233460 RepID=UPI001370196D|nr:ABC transporter permease [Chitinophaga solisilvae]
MIRNYLKVAWRNITNNKILGFINIFGLASGMAFALLICLWIQYERSFDTFHANRHRIARVVRHTLFNGEKSSMHISPLPLYEELKHNYADIERNTRISWTVNSTIIAGNSRYNKSGYHVDPAFLQIFSFPLIKGDIRTALNNPDNIIISASLAEALFGKADPIGKTVQLYEGFTFQVSGVLKDIPVNSSLEFDFLAPYAWLLQHNSFVKASQTEWGNNFLMNVVQLKEGVTMEAFSQKIYNLPEEKNKELQNQHMTLHPLEKWHLQQDFKNWQNTGGKITYVRLFAIIGLFVLLVACINFMNLATARSEKRAREVGIRKAAGSRRIQLVVQFLSESMLTAFLAFFMALGIIFLSLPLIRDIGFENIHFRLSNVFLLAAMFAVCIITGLIAGSYPALYLSSFIPVRVLKGKFASGRGAGNFRRVLVVSQFVISIALIVSTIFVYQQIRYGQQRSVGYNPDNLLTVRAAPNLLKNYDALKQELLGTGYVEAVSKASQPMTEVYNSWSDFSWEGKDPKADLALDAIMADYDFEKTVGLKFLQGRPFSAEFPTDSGAVILNQAALRLIGYKDPIGRKMKGYGGKELTIIGIVEDIVLKDPYKPVYPLAILFAGSFNNIFLRLKKDADITKALAAVQPVFSRNNLSAPFEYAFTDQEFDKKFALEKQVGKLAGIFAGLAIFISCLGLFGLATYMAERRTREIGIRKVLGAPVVHLWLLLSKEFIWLVLTACLIASPLTFFFIRHWLENYDYRITVSIWVFVATGLLALLIALLTVSTQAIKSALANPVKSLKAD